MFSPVKLATLIILSSPLFCLSPPEYIYSCAATFSVLFCSAATYTPAPLPEIALSANESACNTRTNTPVSIPQCCSRSLSCSWCSPCHGTRPRGERGPEENQHHEPCVTSDPCSPGTARAGFNMLCTKHATLCNDTACCLCMLRQAHQKTHCRHCSSTLAQDSPIPAPP